MKSILSALALVAAMVAARPAPAQATCFTYPDGTYTGDTCGGSVTFQWYAEGYYMTCVQEAELTNYILPTTCRIRGVGYCDMNTVCSSSPQVGPLYSPGHNPAVLSLALFCSCTLYMGKTTVITFTNDNAFGKVCSCSGGKTCGSPAYIQWALCD